LGRGPQPGRHASSPGVPKPEAPAPNAGAELGAPNALPPPKAGADAAAPKAGAELGVPKREEPPPKGLDVAGLEAPKAGVEAGRPKGEEAGAELPPNSEEPPKGEGVAAGGGGRACERVRVRIWCWALAARAVLPRWQLHTCVAAQRGCCTTPPDHPGSRAQPFVCAPL